MIKRVLHLVALSFFFVGLLAQTSKVCAEVAIISNSGGFQGPSQFDQTVGWAFHLSTQVTLTDLGVYDNGHDGFAQAHEVGLWTISGALLASGNLPVGPSGSLLGDYRYVPVSNVVLPVGDYVVGAHWVGEFDLFEQGSTVVQTHPFITHTKRAGAGPGFVFPTIVGAPEGNFLTSNFQFSIVPEPSCVAMLGFGGLAMLGSVIRRRPREDWFLSHPE